MTNVTAGLGEILRHTKKSTKASLSDLTVLSPQNDPFRLDTPANHTKGRWFRDNMEACRLFNTAARIHNRGIHYAIVSMGNARLPDDSPYINNADCWAFLEEASNTSRWLGYVPWEKIIDARNSEPIIRIFEEKELGYKIEIDSEIYLPDAEDIKPRIKAVGFEAKQHFRLAFYGEKTSLGGVLESLAQEFGADLYLPAGEISNTLLAKMARTGAEDGREMIVFIFADCDPAGYQMATSIGHKLRALRDSLYPSLLFQVHAPALTVDQVKTLGLPSTPLKETELRAAGWRDRYGVEQTEIDALATLQPGTLRTIAKEAIDQYFDHTLAGRTWTARREWEEAAQTAFENQIDADLIADIHSRATADLNALREKLAALEIATDGLYLELPGIWVPEPHLSEAQPKPLVSSAMPLVEHIRILRGRKDYSGGAE